MGHSEVSNSKFDGKGPLNEIIPLGVKRRPYEAEIKTLTTCYTVSKSIGRANCFENEDVARDKRTRALRHPEKCPQETNRFSVSLPVLKRVYLVDLQV